MLQYINSEGKSVIDHDSKVVYTHNDGGREKSGRKGSTGDCVCRAIAIVTGKPYDEIYERLANGNATQRITKHTSPKLAGIKTASHGIYTNRKWFKDYMKELGFTWYPCMTVGTGCQVHFKAEELPAGKLICSLSRHYSTMIDGVIHDIYDPSRNGTRCVYGYWRYDK